MGAFTPFKKRANAFNYTPRFYDPAKEDREQRREELLGKRLDSGEEYTPGEMIRTQRNARRRRVGEGKSPFRVWIMLAIIVVLLGMGSALFNSITSMMSAKSEAQQEESFNPEATIIIVPNDYVEQ